MEIKDYMKLPYTRLAIEAEKEGVSLNQLLYINWHFNRYTGWQGMENLPFYFAAAVGM